MSTFDLEQLEDRRLCSITWANRGKPDAFDRYYKQNAPVARTIVDAAIADWNKALPVAKLKLRLTIVATDLDAGRRVQNTLGENRGTVIKLDKDGAGHTWYFDPDLDDNSDFKTGVFFQGFGYYHAQLLGKATDSFVSDKADFYTVVLHEIGHALGFSDRGNPFRIQTGPNRWKTDSHHARDNSDLMYPIVGAGGRHLITPYDISHTPWGQSLKSPNPPRSFLSATAMRLNGVTYLDWNYPQSLKDIGIYRSTTPGTDPAAAQALLLFTVTAGHAGFADTTAIPGQTYYYFVVPSDNPRVAATLVSPPDAGAPATLQAVDTPEGVRLSWTQPGYNTSVTVYRSTTNAGSIQASGAVRVGGYSSSNANGQAYMLNDTGVAPGTTYYYWLSTTFDNGLQKVATESATPIAIARAPLAFVPTVKAIVSGALVHVSWPLIPNAVSYRLYRSTTNAGSLEASADVADIGILDQIASPAINDGTTAAGVTYYYWVVAKFSGGATYKYAAPAGPVSRP